MGNAKTTESKQQDTNENSGIIKKEIATHSYRKSW